ncbi:MAG TPA: DUF1993 domain-containing protein [Pseudoxanthomonas sp.]|nr:DUF1993 domain-containing protein [Pseudoxanthomonas sp.]
MSLSLYDVSLPVFIRAFGNLSGNLQKGRAFADENNLPHAELLEARLFPDMIPLTAQIQRASDSAKLAAVRVGQVETIAMADNETSFDELQARIAATVAFLESVPVDSMAGREQAEVVVTTPGQSITFTARDYMLGFAIPNFFFHVTTAYALLRHKGVPLGKLDFLGRR